MGIAAGRKLLTVPADAALAGKLAARYGNAALGEIGASTQGAASVFDFGEYASEVASRTNPDGTVSFITIVPGMSGLEFVVGEKGDKRSLTTRDGQHEYVFVEAASGGPPLGEAFWEPRRLTGERRCFSGQRR